MRSSITASTMRLRNSSVESPSENDIQDIVTLLVVARSKSATADFPSDRYRTEQTVRTCIAAPHIYFRVLKIDGRVAGIICGLIAPSLDFDGDTATDIAFYVVPEFRGDGGKMLDGFIEWAFGFKSVKYVSLNVSMGGCEAERTEKWYSRRGYQKTGASFVARRKE